MPVKKATNTKNEAYKLSENSKKTRDEFGEANAITSLLYNRFKQVMDLRWNRQQLHKLKMLILKIIRSGPIEQTGNRLLWDGDLQLLEGFQLNHKATAGNLFRKAIHIDIGTETNIKISIAPFKYHQAFEKAHPKTTTAQVKLYVFSFDILNKQSAGRSVILLNQAHGEDHSEDYRFDLTLDDNRLNLLICKVSFKSITNGSDIKDRQYIGATLLKAVYIKNGKRVSFVPEEKKEHIKITEPLPGEWEDLG